MLLEEELDEAMEECLRLAKPPAVSWKEAIKLLDLSAEELSDCVVVLTCALGLAGDDSGWRQGPPSRLTSRTPACYRCPVSGYRTCRHAAPGAPALTEGGIPCPG